MTLLGGGGGGAGRGDFVTAFFFSSFLPLPACDPIHTLLGYPCHFAEICGPQLHVNDKSNAKK